MVANPRPPTREELAKFLPDQRSIKAFEQLFALVPDGYAKLIDEALIDIGSATAAARSAGDIIKRMEDALQLVATRPPTSPPGNLTLSYIDFVNNPAVVEQSGRAWWNNKENCLNIASGDSVLQVGFEQYLRVKNGSGTEMFDGQVVAFDSVDGIDGEVVCALYLADGNQPPPYVLGTITGNLLDGAIGNSTKFGKLRGQDTSAWTAGTVLYASPTIAGAMTDVRPTAPNFVVAMGLVLIQDATEGEIIISPTTVHGFDYGEYSSTTTQTLAAADTGYPVAFENVEIEQGISIVDDTKITVDQSGLFLVSISLQITSQTGSVITAYAWMRKNGTDLPRSRLDFTIKANGDTKILATTFQLKLANADYLEVVWAASNANVELEDRPVTAFAPEAPSAIVSIHQIQL